MHLVAQGAGIGFLGSIDLPRSSSCSGLVLVHFVATTTFMECQSGVL